MSGNGIRGAHISKGTQPRVGGKGGFGQVFLSAGNPKRVNQRDAFRGRERGIAHETRHTGKKEQADRASKHNGRRPGYSSNGVKPHPLGPTRSTSDRSNTVYLTRLTVFRPTKFLTNLRKFETKQRTITMLKRDEESIRKMNIEYRITMNLLSEESTFCDKIIYHFDRVRMINLSC